MSIKDFFRKLLRIGLVAAEETAIDQSTKGPITTGNILKPAAKEAAKAAAGAAIDEILPKDRA